ncbi:hypothetical protein OG881_17840 [Streptomyces virginiae]|nr:hypothetical protein [Streptomyces virginiae]
MEDLPAECVSALLQVGVRLELPPVARFVGRSQDVQGLGDPPLVGDHVARRGGPVVARQHPDHVEGRHCGGVDGVDDPRNVLPVPLDPHQVDPAPRAESWKAPQSAARSIRHIFRSGRSAGCGAYVNPAWVSGTHTMSL